MVDIYSKTDTVHRAGFELYQVYFDHNGINTVRSFKEGVEDTKSWA